jgi:hypothetical protein
MTHVLSESIHGKLFSGWFAIKSMKTQPHRETDDAEVQAENMSNTLFGDIVADISPRIESVVSYYRLFGNTFLGNLGVLGSKLSHHSTMTQDSVKAPITSHESVQHNASALQFSFPPLTSVKEW